MSRPAEMRPKETLQNMPSPSFPFPQFKTDKKEIVGPSMITD